MIEKIKKFIIEYRKKNGKSASPKIIMREFRLTKDEMYTYLQQLQEARVIKKYPPDEKRVSSYHVPSDVLQNEIKEDRIKEETKRLSPKALFVIGIVIRVFMGLVANAVILISASFSLKWTGSFLDPFIAWIFSVALPLYSSFAIEAGIYIRYKVGIIKANGKLSIPLASIILFASAGITMCIELSAITIGLFNSKTELIYAKSETVPKNNNEESLTILKNQESQILNNSDYKYLKNKIENYKNSFEYGSKEYKNLETDILKARTEFKVYETKIEKNRTDQQKILDDSKTVLTDSKEEVRKDFYAWLENNFHFAKAGVVEFITYLMPALFCVLLAPLGVFVAVGLYRQKQ